MQLRRLDRPVYRSMATAFTMTARYFAGATCLATILGLSGSSAMAQRSPADCKIVVRGHTILDGDCLFAAERNGFVVYFAGPDPASNQFRLTRLAPNRARLRWATPDTAEVIDGLKAADACWVNPTVQFCVWKPGERGSIPPLDGLKIPPAGAGPASLRIPKFPPNEYYGRARSSLLALGYQPVVTPDADKCGDGDSRCAGRPEMQSCSGTGMAYCAFLWRGPQEQLIEIITAGEDARVDSVICRANCN